MSNRADSASDTPNNIGRNSTNLDLKPVENPGIRVVWFGIFVWSIALVALLVAHDWLTRTNRESWIYVAASGIALGLIGQIYIRRRFKIS